MDLTHLKGFISDLTWFEPTHNFVGAALPLRPLSLGTWHIMKIIGLSLFDEAVELSLEEEMKQLGVYIWLHSAKLEVVTEALWSSDWRLVYEEFNEPQSEIIARFRSYRTRCLSALEAAKFSIQNRPKPDKDDTPKDLVGPRDLTFLISLLRRETGCSREEALWHTWYPQVKQLELAALRWQGIWTVAPSAPVPSAPVDFAPAWARPPQIDTPPSS